MRFSVDSGNNFDWPQTSLVPGAHIAETYRGERTDEDEAELGLANYSPRPARRMGGLRHCRYFFRRGVARYGAPDGLEPSESRQQSRLRAAHLSCCAGQRP